MIKLSVILVSAALMCACDSSSTTTRVSGVNGAGTGGTATGGSGSSGGSASGSGGCAPPTLGNVFTSATPNLLNDGCLDTGTMNVGDANSHGTMSPLVLTDTTSSDDPATATDIPQNAKGLYIYTDGSAPAYVVAYTRRGYYFRAGELGVVTRGPGIYYLPFERVSAATGSTLDGLTLSAWSMVPGEAVNISEVTWADAADDVTAQPKLHWKQSGLAPNQFYPLRHQLTLASSGHGLRQLTHALSEEIVSQYVALVSSNDCPLTFSGSDIPAIQFVDASAELGQAWQGRDVLIGSTDDPLRKVYTVAIDWVYADDSTVPSIIASIDAKDYLWPNPNNPNINMANCLGQLGAATDYDVLRQQVLDSGDNSGWLH